MSNKTDIGSTQGWKDILNISRLKGGAAGALSLFRDMAKDIFDSNNRDYIVRMLPQLLGWVEELYPEHLKTDSGFAQFHEEMERELLRRMGLIYLESEPYESPTLVPAKPPPRLPHFRLSASEEDQQHWADTHDRLTKLGYIVKDEVKAGQWVYLCCGAGPVLSNPVTWHGTKAALAYMVRQHLGGEWDTASRVFYIPGHKPLQEEKSFKTTNPPNEKVKAEIDKAFKKNKEAQ